MGAGLARLGRRVAIVLVATACVLVQQVGSSAGAAPSELAPKHPMLTRHAAAADAKPAKPGNPGGGRRSNGIDYHGGPIITGTTNAYVIWYGNWPAGNTTQPILANLLSSIGGSPYFSINTTYYNGAGVHVTNSVALKGTTSVAYPYGTALSDAAIAAIVRDAINANALPSDTNGVYFVLTSADVSETSGFLTQYCGWHDHTSINSKDIKFAFIGDPSANMAACSVQPSTSPNGNPAADAMASVVAHELEEATTDPDLNAWFDSRGYENADKCAWTFGTTYKVANGSLANMKLGGRDYLIQRNWVNANGGSCQLKW